jgi:hypothetical protein
MLQAKWSKKLVTGASQHTGTSLGWIEVPRSAAALGLL